MHMWWGRVAVAFAPSACGLVHSELSLSSAGDGWGTPAALYFVHACDASFYTAAPRSRMDLTEHQVRGDVAWLRSAECDKQDARVWSCYQRFTAQKCSEAAIRVDTTSQLK